MPGLDSVPDPGLPFSHPVFPDPPNFFTANHPDNIPDPPNLSPLIRTMLTIFLLSRGVFDRAETTEEVAGGAAWQWWLANLTKEEGNKRRRTVPYTTSLNFETGAAEAIPSIVPTTAAGRSA